MAAPLLALLAAAVGAGALLVIYLYAGFALPGDVDVMRHSSGLYDMDVPRVVADVTTRLRAYRTGVHPLQKLLLAPVGQWVNVHVFDGGGRLAAAKVLIALAMTLNALLVGVLAWQLARRSLPAGLLAGALCGVSFSSLKFETAKDRPWMWLLDAPGSTGPKVLLSSAQRSSW